MVGLKEIVYGDSLDKLPWLIGYLKNPMSFNLRKQCVLGKSTD